jgi:hypothetical protein
MTDLRNQLARLLDTEPDAPYDIDDIVRSGRRARRRHQVALAAAGTIGAAGVTAAVVVPLMATAGDEARLTVRDRPSPTPSPTASVTGRCYLVAGPPKTIRHEIDRLVRSGRVKGTPSVTVVKTGNHGGRAIREVCPKGSAPTAGQHDAQAHEQEPAGPAYRYTDDPAAIAARLGAQLHDRVTGLGLSITYTRPFSQESATLDKGRPSYFGGNVDVHEASGYADIGVQVTHETTQFVPFTGDCTAAEDCTETTLPDGSVMRTGRANAGKGNVVLTAEVHRPDGVVVQAQESNYPFGPDAGSQPHGDQPLTLDQLAGLAKDDAFTF